jgi:transcriptional regulator of acetoin/glycerol metabolism
MAECPSPPAAGNKTSTTICAFRENGELRDLADIEAEVIRLALVRCRGSVTEAARQLGVGRSTLYRRLMPTSVQCETA